MAVKIEAFLAIEQGLSERLKGSWRKVAVQTQKRLQAAAANGQWAEVSKIIDKLDLTPVIEENVGYLRYMSYAALLFGASRLSKNVKSSMVARGDMEPVLRMSISRLTRTVHEQMRPMLQQMLHEEAERMKEERQSALLVSVQKWDPSKHPRHPKGVSTGGQFKDTDGPQQGDLLTGEFEPAPHMDIVPPQPIDFSDDLDWDIDNLEDNTRGQEVIDHYVESGTLRAVEPPKGSTLGTMYLRGEGKDAKVYTVDDEGWASSKDRDEFIRDNAEEAYPDIEEQFNTDFWESPGSLYHATPEDNIEAILSEGLEMRHISRGMNNRHIMGAVFTADSWEGAERNAESYGPAIFEIDTEAMKRDGHTPFVFREPDVVERDREGALANWLGDDQWSTDGGSDGEVEDTIIIDSHIDPKYLKLVTEHEAKVTKREQVRKWVPDQPRGKSTPASRGGSFRKNHTLVTTEEGRLVRGWSVTHQQIIGTTDPAQAKRFASKEAFTRWVMKHPGAQNTVEEYLDRYQFFDERDEAKPWEKVLKFDPAQPREPAGTSIGGRWAKALAAVGGMGDPTGFVQPSTREFKQWFGESVVIDQNGDPLPMFHMTAADFEVFGVNPDNPVIDRLVGPHFAVDPRVSNTFAFEHNSSDFEAKPGANMVPVYLSVQNPRTIPQISKGTFTDVGGQPYEAFETDQYAIAVDIAEVVFSESKERFIEWAVNERLHGNNWQFTETSEAQQRAGEIWEHLKARTPFPRSMWESLGTPRQHEGDYMRTIDVSGEEFNGRPFGQFVKSWASFGMAWEPSTQRIQSRMVEDYKRILKERGYDGITYRNTAPMETEGHYTLAEMGAPRWGDYPANEELRFHTYTIIPFDPNQIKSVFNERPTSDERITKYAPDQARHPKGGVWASSGPAPGRFAPSKGKPMGEFGGVQLPLNEHGDPYITDHGSLTAHGLTGSTKEQVQAFMRWRYPDAQWDFDQFNPYVTNELAFEANNVLKRYPWILNGLAGIKKAPFETVKRYFDEGKGTWAIAKYDGMIEMVGFDLLVEEGNGADLSYNNLRDGADNSRRSGFHPPNFTVGAIVTHEMGHVVDYMMGATYTTLDRMKSEGTPLDEQQQEFWSAYEEFKARNGMAFEEFRALDAGDEYYSRGVEPYFSGLSFPSSYATKNEAETFAEAFQEWVVSTHRPAPLPLTTHHELVPGRTRSMSLSREEGDGPTVPLKDRPPRDNLSIYMGPLVTAYDRLQRTHFSEHPEIVTWDQKFGEAKTVPVRRLGDILPRVPRE